MYIHVVFGCVVIGLITLMLYLLYRYRVCQRSAAIEHVQEAKEAILSVGYYMAIAALSWIGVAYAGWWMILAAVIGIPLGIWAAGMVLLVFAGVLNEIQRVFPLPQWASIPLTSFCVLGFAAGAAGGYAVLTLIVVG